VTLAEADPFTIGPTDLIAVVRRDGRIFGHTVQDHTISPPFELRTIPPSSV
jgi:hypothetical protein